MSFDPMRRPPIVTDADRQWAIEQKPSDWDTTTRGLEWEDHVAEQVERFEREMRNDRKPATEWSGLWRRGWWPLQDAAVLHPDTASQGPPPIIVRRGDAIWERALRTLPKAKRALAEKLGVVPFRVDDPRVEKLKLRANT